MADFGYAKKSDDAGNLVLGTDYYMSPEIFTNEIYGFEVDIWAFGVLFFYMLNMDHPFSNSFPYLEINPHLSVEKKRT